MGRRTNLALAVLVSTAFVTGVAGFLLGGSSTGFVLVVHGVAGLAIVLLVPWKSIVVRRGLRRERPNLMSIALAATVVATIATGILHSAGLWRARGVWSAMGLHVAAAIAVVVPFVWHLRTRPQRPRRGDLGRRAVLRAGVVLGGAVAVRAVTRDDLRYTGSYEIGSFEPAAMPVVQWFDDSPPTIELDGWTLDVGGMAWSYDDLLTAPEDVVATLDCTGGWYSTQRWRGVRVDRVLEQGGRSVVVRSATGYERLLPRSADLLLATHVDDEPLSRGHGFPVRLVAPGRRGFWWVKWVVSVRTSDRPWWLQTPVPFT